MKLKLTQAQVYLLQLQWVLDSVVLVAQDLVVQDLVAQDLVAQALAQDLAQALAQDLVLVALDLVQASAVHYHSYLHQF